MHKSFWFQLHWFLGIVFGLILLIIGVSGAVLSYEKEILAFINKDTYYVKVPEGKTRLELKEILEKYQSANPKDMINSISFSSDKSSSVVLNILIPNNRRGLNVYIDPYTGESLPNIVGKDFFIFFFNLHRWLAFDSEYREIGRKIVGISTIVCIVLVVGGLIVYFPRVRRNFFKSFTFSFRHKNRAFLSTLHSAVGMWLIPSFLLLCLTGLYWSFEWYRSAMFKVFQVEQVTKGHLPRQVPKYNPKFDEVQKTFDIFKQNVLKDYKNANIKIMPNKSSIYTVSYLYTDASHFREINSMDIDINKETLIKDSKFKDKKLNQQIMDSIFPLHTGEYFGWIGQLLMFVSASLMALFVISGYLLYYDRWKKKRQKIQKLKI